MSAATGQTRVPMTTHWFGAGFRRACTQALRICIGNMLTIKKPFLLIIGDMTNPRNAKTAFGLR
ncbi:hypothetical protein, partial [Sphingosinicella sp.]|uniref:hypothetical protein n=1 Tax=Sphingosinicella sp. TaxID=1917971 RepID=UPI00263943FA